MEPNTLIHKTNEGVRVIRTGVGNLSKAAQVHTRIPAGHPEGYFEAFANLYRNFGLTIKAQLKQEEAQPEMLDFPGIEEGIRGMAFIENVIASGKSDLKWTAFTI